MRRIIREDRIWAQALAGRYDPCLLHDVPGLSIAASQHCINGGADGVAVSDRERKRPRPAHEPNS